MSHTPEPWKGIEKTGYIFDAKGRVIGTSFLSGAEGKANTHLMAAAARLLNSLQELSEWMREHTGPRDGTLEMLIRAVETIKAAGGKIR